MYSFTILLYVISLLYHLFDINESGPVLPTVTNTSGEYYILLNDNNDNKRIVCSHPTLCYIECSEANSCETSTINASSTNNLTLKCNQNSACKAAKISNGPQIEANIFCTAYNGYACSQSTFFLNTTNIVNLKCDNDVSCSGSCSNYSWGGCYSMTLWAQNANEVDVDCENIDCYLATFHLETVQSKAILTATGRSSLWDANVYAANAKQLDVNCDNWRGCRGMEIFPPYQSQYAFSLYCVAERYSCDDVDITVPNSQTFINNYMELICPRTNREGTDETDCDIRWYCEDLSTSISTSTTFDTVNYRYICNDNDCCPWSDAHDMIQNVTNPAIIPQTNSITPTTTNSTGEYYILSTTTSYKSIYCNNQAGCYIDCTAESSCASAYIYAGKTNNLTLICSGKSSCTDIYITEGPMVEANIYCTAHLGYACSDAVFIMSETANINLQCTSPSISSCNNNCDHGGCYHLVLWAQDADSINVDCEFEDCYKSIFHLESIKNKATLTATANYGLEAAKIYAANANNLDINCNQYAGCKDMDIYPPYTSEYSFSLYCVAEPDSCSMVDIFIPNSQQFTTDYMELICPQTNRITSHCNIRWYCQDLSTSSPSTVTQFDTTYPRYICNDNDCCPWTDPDHMIKNSTNPFIIPYRIGPTTINSTGEYYILSTTTPYKPFNCQSHEGCYIECAGDSSCVSAYIYAAETNYLTLICSGKSSCTDIYITEGPMIEANIYCGTNKRYACTDAVFIMSEAPNINLKCHHDSASSSPYDYGGCYSITLWAQNSDTVDVEILIQLMIISI